MTELLSVPILPLILTLAAFQVGRVLQARFRSPFLNPILIAVILVLAFLFATRMPVAEYQLGMGSISWLLTPATVCLAIPLYRQVRLVRKYALSLLAGIAAGVAASILSVLVIALIFEMDHAGYVTLLPKSITTAIGMVVSREQGGVENITVAVIVLTGVFGNLMASPLCRLFRLTDPVARGVAIGTSSHAIGTARAMEMDDVTGAVSGLSIAVSGVLTVAAAAILGNLV